MNPPDVIPGDYLPGTLIQHHPEPSYRSAPGLSSTQLKTFAHESPKHYQLKYLARTLETPVSENMLLGSLVHCLVLEPDVFGQRYERELVLTDHPGALVTADDLKGYCRQHGLKLTGVKRDLIERVRAHNPDTLIWDDRLGRQKHSRKTVISQALWSKAQAMRNSVYANPDAAQLLARGEAEVSVWGELHSDDDTPLLCKCRPDWLTSEVCVDLKTCACASPAAFSRDCARFGYDLQQVHYTDTLAATGREVSFLFIAVESQPPHLCQVYMIPDDEIQRVREHYYRQLTRLAHCQQTDDWPGYAPSSSYLNLPGWHLNTLRIS